MKQHFSKPFWKVIGARVKFYRKNAPVKLTQKELAEIIEVNATTVSHLEAGNRGTSVRNLMILADYFQVPPVALMTRQELSDDDLLLYKDFWKVLSEKKEHLDRYACLKTYVSFLLYED